MSEFLVKIDVDSHTEILSSRQYWKTQAEQLAEVAREADEKWRAIVKATREKYDNLRTALHTVLEVEDGVQLPDEQVVELLNAEVRISRAMDRPATATMDVDRVQVLEWPDAVTVAAVVPVERTGIPAAEQTMVVGDPSSSTPNMPGLTGRRFQLGEQLGDVEPRLVVTAAGEVWAFRGHNGDGQAEYDNEEGFTLAFSELLARCTTLYEVQPAEQLAQTNGAAQ